MTEQLKHQHYLHPGGYLTLVPSKGTRPVVVIDPEDGEQVERFREIASRWADQVPYNEGPGDLNYTTAMQAALREFANPKPEEPTGLGAVVETESGRRYVRQVDGWWRSDEPCSANWAAIAAVRVLSEGVQ